MSAPLPDNTADLLRRIAEDPELMTIAHLAIEDHLIMMRDAGMFTGPHANGFVVREKDASDSSIIRLGTRPGIEMAFHSIADHLSKGN